MSTRDGPIPTPPTPTEAVVAAAREVVKRYNALSGTQKSEMDALTLALATYDLAGSQARPTSNDPCNVTISCETGASNSTTITTYTPFSPAFVTSAKTMKFSWNKEDRVWWREFKGPSTGPSSECEAAVEWAMKATLITARARGLSHSVSMTGACENCREEYRRTYERLLGDPEITRIRSGSAPRLSTGPKLSKGERKAALEARLRRTR